MRLTISHCDKRKSPARFESGIGLIEVLITLFILAIGLLGIAGAQFMSKRANFEAAQRTTATLLANDILDRMRANAARPTPAVSTLSEYVTQGAEIGGTVITESAVPVAGDALAIATRDIWEWGRAIAGVTEIKATGGETINTGGLVSPTACLYTTVAPGSVDSSGQYMVAIVWRGSAKLSDPINPAVPAPDPDPYTCGRASGNYNSNDPVPVVDVHRRILVVTTYIGE